MTGDQLVALMSAMIYSGGIHSTRESVDIALAINQEIYEKLHKPEGTPEPWHPWPKEKER